MKVKVLSKKGHWNGGEFVPFGGAFDFPGDAIPEGMQDRIEAVDGKKAADEAPADGGDGTPPLNWGALPASVTDKLKAAGLDTPEKVAAASDASLLAIDGIGEGTVKVIRGQIK